MFISRGGRLATARLPGMQRMRHTVRQHNVYRWAAHLLSDLTEIRIELVERAEA